MPFLPKQFISWLLLLMMFIGNVHASMAADFDQDCHGANCQMSDMVKDCAMNQDEHCQNHVSCVSSSSSFFQVSSEFLITSNKSTATKFTIDNDNIQAHYPELLKRPPRS